ncbi:unnamed protein product [Owenia fusiformis]|uniref:Uncharacterized protein n=1 Tax=Owenia fusiformis TaxID=6347 RepID=A0A8J1TB44_OWEFU|nr:unnamed protein product [Owenia fusiformis]
MNILKLTLILAYFNTVQTYLLGSLLDNDLIRDESDNLDDMDHLILEDKNKVNQKRTYSSDILVVSRQSSVCPQSEDGRFQFICPSSRHSGTTRCVDDHQICNGRRDCPNHEDENPTMCLFYQVVQSQIKMVTNVMLARGK